MIMGEREWCPQRDSNPQHSTNAASGAGILGALTLLTPRDGACEPSGAFPDLRTCEGRHTAEDFRIRILDGVALNGSSGSPVLTDTGKVLGMIYAGHSTKAKSPDEYQWAVRLNVITTACPVISPDLSVASGC